MIRHRRDVARALGDGWRYEGPRGSGHLAWRHERSGRLLIAAGSPGCAHALRNMLADARRIEREAMTPAAASILATTTTKPEA